MEFLKGGPVELKEILRALCLIHDPGASVVTLALNVGMPGTPRAEAGDLLTNRMLGLLGSKDHPLPTREILWKVAGRVASTIENGLRKETQGLYLVAGPGILQPFELGAPIEDFLYIGRTPYLAPLLEALTRMPRTYVLRFDREEGILEEVLMGARREIEHIPSVVVERNAEHQTAGHSTRGRTGAGRPTIRQGGGGRDRFRHCIEDSVEVMLHKAADKVRALQREAPSESIYAFGDRKHFPVFRDRLPARLRTQAIHGGPLPQRQGEVFGKSIREQEDLRVRGRIDREILEFQARREERCHVASGPEAILTLLDTGKVARVFLDARDPLPGTACPACEVRAGAGQSTCRLCGKPLVPTSMTQEVVSHTLLHPPVPLTFVPSGQAWLKESGGMAALLSEKGIHSRR